MFVGWFYGISTILVHYYGCDFSDFCLHLYCNKLKYNVSAAVSSGLSQVSLVYLGTEITQPRKSFLV